ncbi:tetratricopeptide repeat protein, partial [Streptomyces scabiei]|uniref:tetratricopeptide repeat protein n=1 Tax=Streptomyces scabiei TaxID=1930 RepID=UPI0038F7B6AC
PTEGFINEYGYAFLQQKKYDKAGRFFKMNVDNYPESFNVYDSYGDYFLAIDNKPKAIENFKKALSIKENPESRQKLNKLLGL